MVSLETVIHWSYRDQKMSFYTNEKVFSPKAVDKGTLAMLSQVEFAQGDKVLDLGCGYGAVGILAAKLLGTENVTMCDISGNALELTRKNLLHNGAEGVCLVKSDGLDDVEGYGFTLILSNPPYHTDFSVAKRFIEKGYRKLAIGGKMFMVTKRKEWYKNKFIGVFGGVRIIEIDDYFVFMAEKLQRDSTKYKTKEKKNP